MSSLLGQSLGRYHILEQIGEGGMAIVYKAYDTRLEANVAVKVIRTENLAPSILENALIRFEREAKSLAKLTHPNIVKVLDYGEYEGKPYLVMPYLPGGTLKQKLHGIPMPYQEAASILIPIARALAYAHQQGLVHRDVKPSNVLITQSGDPMLTDFGIAKILGEEVALDLTGTSATIGTPEYMAPEQATSKSVDHRADIYALGIVLFEMVTGRRPYQADTPMAVLIKQISEPLPRPKTFAPDLPDAVENILLKALAKTPDDRYQNMNDFAAALEQMARGDVTPAMKKVASPPATLTDYLPSPARTRDTTSLLTQRVSRQFEQSPVPKSSAGQRWLAFGVGGIGMLIAGICLIAVVVIILRGISAPATPAPYVQSTAPIFSTVVVYPTAGQQVEVYPTAAQQVDVYPTIPPLDTIVPTEDVPTATSTPSCPGAKYPTRIQPKRDARICTKTERLIVRVDTNRSAKEKFSLYTGTYVHIIEGPTCSDDAWWWKIEIYPGTPWGLQYKNGGLPMGTTDQSYTGWVREGPRKDEPDEDSYYLCQ
jgi:serine/threonine protein kinase